MEWTYWKITCKYGHVGNRKEVSVARHLVLPEKSTLLDACEMAKEMPGVKNRGVVNGRKITLDGYLQGHREEMENFFLQKLKSHKPYTA